MATLALPRTEPALPPLGAEPGPKPAEVLIREARRRRRRRWAAATLCALVAGGTGAWAGVRSGSPAGANLQQAANPGTATEGAALAATSPCASSVTYGPLPTWARAGFNPADMAMPYVLGAKGDIVAVLWSRRAALAAPPVRGRNNKVLWVSRLPVAPESNLVISAHRLAGTRLVGAVQHRVVLGGPGPSSIDMPVRGCWRFTLSWSGHHDSVDLRYSGGTS